MFNSSIMKIKYYVCVMEDKNLRYRLKLLNLNADIRNCIMSEIRYARRIFILQCLAAKITL